MLQTVSFVSIIASFLLRKTFELNIKSAVQQKVKFAYKEFGNESIQNLLIFVIKIIFKTSVEDYACSNVSKFVKIYREMTLGCLSH